MKNIEQNNRHVFQVFFVNGDAYVGEFPAKSEGNGKGEPNMASHWFDCYHEGSSLAWCVASNISNRNYSLKEWFLSRVVNIKSRCAVAYDPASGTSQRYIASGDDREKFDEAVDKFIVEICGRVYCIDHGIDYNKYEHRVAWGE